MGRGPAAFLHRGVPELHDSSHEPVGVEAAPKPSVVPEHLLAHLHGKLGSTVGVKVVCRDEAVAYIPLPQTVLEC